MKRGYRGSSLKTVRLLWSKETSLKCFVAYDKYGRFEHDILIQLNFEQSVSAVLVLSWNWTESSRHR
jgi:hypothetical protein